MRDTAGSAAAPAARCRNMPTVESFINIPLWIAGEATPHSAFMLAELRITCPTFSALVGDEFAEIAWDVVWHGHSTEFRKPRS